MADNPPAGPGRFKNAGAAVASILIFVFVVAWSVVVMSRIGDPPKLQTRTDGAYDRFEQAKSVFVLVLPLLTTAAGYWLGSLGTAKAEKKADDATKQKDAVLDAAPPELDLLNLAKTRHPSAFDTIAR